MHSKTICWQDWACARRGRGHQSWYLAQHEQKLIRSGWGRRMMSCPTTHTHSDLAPNGELTSTDPLMYCLLPEFLANGWICIWVEVILNATNLQFYIVSVQFVLLHSSERNQRVPYWWFSPILCSGLNRWKVYKPHCGWDVNHGEASFQPSMQYTSMKF